MDRTEAYKMLISEIESVSTKPKSDLFKLVDKTIDTEKSSQSGKHYSISINVIKKGNNYHIKGKIHDNNSFKYELLEEKIIVEI